jgi:hypothetical protein
MLYLHGVLSCLVLMYLPREKFLASIERCVEIGIANRNKNKNNLNTLTDMTFLSFSGVVPEMDDGPAQI